MPTLLRLRDNSPQWPYSVAQFRADEPGLSISNNPHPGELATYATLEPPILVFQVEATAPPKHDSATHWAREIAPVQVDGKWQQAWELVELPTAPPPPPNWLEFRQAIFTENGYVDAHAAALNSDDNRIKFAATGLFVFLQNFENTGNWEEYLQALLLTVSNPSLSLSEQAKLAQEFLGLAQRCNLPLAFIEAFQQAIIPPVGSE